MMTDHTNDTVEALIYPNQQQIDAMRVQALTFQAHITDDLVDTLYMVSLRWLNRWKVHISYEEFIKGEPPSKYLAGPELWPINKDLVMEQRQALFKYYPLQTHKWNVWLRPNLTLDVDFIFVTEVVWNLLRQSVQGIPIVRTMSIAREIEVYCKQVNMGIINQTIVGNIRADKISKIFSGYLQTSNHVALQDWIDCIERTVKTFKQYEFEPGCIQLWQLSDMASKEDLYSEFKRQLLTQNASTTYNIHLPGAKLLSPDKFHFVKDCQITDQDFIVIDAKECNNHHVVSNVAPPKQGRCSWCSLITALPLKCECGEASYCKESCQQGDLKFHIKICPTSMKLYELSVSEGGRTSQSIDGKCGLTNLGNTCFMNSGLQCLSNTVALAEYFLADVYKSEKNDDELSNTFALLLKHLWYCKDKQYQPLQFKKQLAKYYSMFSGFQQHDSLEFLIFFLDGLHEHLNAVKMKPYNDATLSNGRDDFVVAIEHWDSHHQRNQSIIQDLFFAQLKSQLTCLQCGYSTTKYDPYMTISLPLSADQHITFYQSIQYQMKLLSHKIPYDPQQNVQELLNEIKNKLNNSNLMFDLSSKQFVDTIILNEGLQSFQSKLKNHKLIVRQLSASEIKIPIESRIRVIVRFEEQTHEFFNDLIRPRSFYICSSFSLQQVHQFLFNEFTLKNQIWDTYHQTVLNCQYTVLLKSNSKGNQQQCYFCGTQNCQDCQLPFSELILVQNLMDRIKDPNFKLEFKINYLKTPQINVEDIHHKEEHKQQNELDLRECFQFFQERATLDQDNLWYCLKCKTHVSAEQTLKLYSSPQYLILHLKRFSGNKQIIKTKINTFVKYPIELDMTDYVINARLPRDYLEDPLHESDQLMYELYAVINHMGGMDSGHYTAYAKNRYDGKFYHYDDSQVHEVKDVVSPNAYVLFYQRKE